VNRQAFYQPPPDIFGILNISISAFYIFISKIFITPYKIAGILGIFLVSFGLGLKIDHKDTYKPWISPAILLAGSVFAYGCFLPAAWGLSDAPPDRNLSIPCFILVVTLLTTGFTAGGTLSLFRTSHWFNFASTGVLAIAAACIIFSAWVNIQDLFSTRRAYVDYAQKWDRVNELVVQAKLGGADVVHIPAMDSWTSLDKPNDNPKFWLNICYSKYYGVQILSP
jgi:hypothetical protein